MNENNTITNDTANIALETVTNTLLRWSGELALVCRASEGFLDALRERAKSETDEREFWEAAEKCAVKPFTIRTYVPEFKEEREAYIEASCKPYTGANHVFSVEVDTNHAVVLRLAENRENGKETDCFTLKDWRGITYGAVKAFAEKVVERGLQSQSFDYYTLNALTKLLAMKIDHARRMLKM